MLYSRIKDSISRYRALYLLPLAVVCVVGIAALLLTPRSLTWPQWNVAKNISQTLKYKTFLDVRELNWYRDEGDWLRRNYLPYIDQPYEYPVLATALFTLPALPDDSVAGYHVRFRVMMIACALILIAFTLRHGLPQSRQKLVWLLLAPSVLYTSLNRFDIAVALTLQVSLVWLYQRHWRGAFIMLALAILLKWYAGLLLPFYLLVLFEHARTWQERKRGFAALLWCVALLVIGHSWPVVVGGSVLDMVNPYAIHFVRSPEVGSFAAAIVAPFGKFYLPAYPLDAGNVDTLTAVLVAVSTLLQLSGLIVLLLVLIYRRTPLADLRTFAHAALLVVGAFVFFNRLYSFQWIVWLAPIFILTLPTRAAVISFFMYDIISYLQSPILFGTFHYVPHFILFTILTVLRSGFLAYCLYPSLRWFFPRAGAGSRDTKLIAELSQ